VFSFNFQFFCTNLVSVGLVEGRGVQSIIGIERDRE
jgi:hypothetical protein